MMCHLQRLLYELHHSLRVLGILWFPPGEQSAQGGWIGALAIYFDAQHLIGHVNLQAEMDFYEQNCIRTGEGGFSSH